MSAHPRSMLTTVNMFLRGRTSSKMCRRKERKKRSRKTSTELKGILRKSRIERLSIEKKLSMLR